MTDPTLEDVERRLDRASELETEAALSTLRTAREDLRALGADSDVDEGRRQELADTIDQRIRQIDDRDAYDSELGAAMNPEDEDAP